VARKIYVGLCGQHELCQKVVEIVKKKVLRANGIVISMAKTRLFGGISFQIP